jgi:hypothetical protein
MPLNSRVLGATLLAIVAATMAPPVRAQQSPPAAGPEAPPPDHGAPPPNGSGAPPPQASPPQDVPPQAAPAGPAKPGLAIANVNLRGGPGTDSEVITTIPGGSPVRVTGCTGEWCAVTWNGHSGYAIARNIDIGGRRPARPYRPPLGYAGGYEPGPPAGYYPPPAVVYGPGYYGYGPGYYGWRRRW